MEPEKGSVTVGVDVPSGQLPLAEAVNWFTMTRVETEFQILVGYLDLRATHELVEKAKATGKTKERLKAEVTHRFSMSLRTFLQMRRQVEQIFANMQQSGLVAREEGESGD